MKSDTQQFPVRIPKGITPVPLCVASHKRCILCHCCCQVRIVNLVPQCLVLMATSGLVCKTYHQAGSKSRCKLVILFVMYMRNLLCCHSNLADYGEITRIGSPQSLKCFRMEVIFGNTHVLHRRRLMCVSVLFA